MKGQFLSLSKRSHRLAIVFLWFLTGCTALGDWVAGSTSHQSPAIVYPEQLVTVQIGVTTQEDIRHLLGDPTDLEVSSADGVIRESWAYARTDPKINPLQYFLGFGVLALPKENSRDSFAISFSPEGIVEGIGLREVQSLDLDLSRKKSSGPMSYGENNPLTHHSR